MDWIKRRAVEASTWRGLGALLVALGIGSAGAVDAAVSVGLAVVALVEVMRKEK